MTISDLSVVTGGSNGIGAATAQLLTSRGQDVIIVDRESPTHDSFHEFLEVDLSNVTQAAVLLAELLGDRTVSRLIHSAGYVAAETFEATDHDEMTKEYRVNVEAFVSLSQAVVPGMKKQNFGRLVAVGSRAALGKPRRTGYSSSKAALSGLVRTWTLELGPSGITSNVVAPGATMTRLMRANNEPGGWFLSNLAERIPTGFIGEPEDIAAIVAFFCSEEARYVSGQVLHACGGTSVGFIDWDAGERR